MCLCVILALLSFPPPARGADMPERKTVVLLYPDPRLLHESIAVEQGIRSTLEPAGPSGIDFIPSISISGCFPRTGARGC
jgi:hypothetical protein